MLIKLFVPIDVTVYFKYSPAQLIFRIIFVKFRQMEVPTDKLIGNFHLNDLLILINSNREKLRAKYKALRLLDFPYHPQSIWDILKPERAILIGSCH